MIKYINANDVYDGMRKHGFEAKYITRGEFVDHLPSADVRENIHGEWKPERTRFGFYCNKCKMYSYWQTDFCPNCGADMRGEKR